MCGMILKQLLSYYAYDIYEGTGGSTAIKDLNLSDEFGNNIINATNQIDDNLYYYSFEIDNSFLQFEIWQSLSLKYSV